MTVEGTGGEEGTEPSRLGRSSRSFCREAAVRESDPVKPVSCSRTGPCGF